jgi:hypothetical protein
MRNKTTTPLHHCRALGLALLATILTTTSATAGTPAPDKPVNLKDLKKPSAECARIFGGGLVDPDTTVSHRYVLLLVFTNRKTSEEAGIILFHADKPASDGTRNTSGCVADPESKANSTTARTGIVVEGDCPTDCTSPKTPPSVATLVENPDPLYNSGFNWGIFNVPKYGTKNANIAVWQIHVKNVVHARKILDGLEDGNGLSDMAGYLGHLVIGYRPMPDNKKKSH